MHVGTEVERKWGYRICTLLPSGALKLPNFHFSKVKPLTYIWLYYHPPDTLFPSNGLYFMVTKKCSVFTWMLSEKILWPVEHFSESVSHLWTDLSCSLAACAPHYSPLGAFSHCTPAAHTRYTWANFCCWLLISRYITLCQSLLLSEHFPDFEHQQP